VPGHDAAGLDHQPAGAELVIGERHLLFREVGGCDHHVGDVLGSVVDHFLALAVGDALVGGALPGEGAGGGDREPGRDGRGDELAFHGAVSFAWVE
jgi:hypothetical protein